MKYEHRQTEQCLKKFKEKWQVQSKQRYSNALANNDDKSQINRIKSNRLTEKQEN